MPEAQTPTTQPSGAVQPNPRALTCHCANYYCDSDELVAGPWDFCSRRCKTEQFRWNREECASDPIAFLEEQGIELGDLLHFAIRPKEFRAQFGFSLKQLYRWFEANPDAIKYYGLK